MPIWRLRTRCSHVLTHHFRRTPIGNLFATYLVTPQYMISFNTLKYFRDSLLLESFTGTPRNMWYCCKYILTCPQANLPILVPLKGHPDYASHWSISRDVLGIDQDWITKLSVLRRHLSKFRRLVLPYILWCNEKSTKAHTELIVSATKCWNMKHNSFTHWSTGAIKGYTPPLSHVR